MREYVRIGRCVVIFIIILVFFLCDFTLIQEAPLIASVSLVMCNLLHSHFHVMGTQLVKVSYLLQEFNIEPHNRIITLPLLAFPPNFCLSCIYNVKLFLQNPYILQSLYFHRQSDLLKLLCCIFLWLTTCKQLIPFIAW